MLYVVLTCVSYLTGASVVLCLVMLVSVLAALVSKYGNCSLIGNVIAVAHDTSTDKQIVSERTRNNYDDVMKKHDALGS